MLFNFIGTISLGFILLTTNASNSSIIANNTTKDNNAIITSVTKDKVEEDKLTVTKIESFNLIDNTLKADVMIVYPFIESSNKKFDKINEEFKINADNLKDLFLKEYNESYSKKLQMHKQIYTDYDILTDNEKILAIKVVTAITMASSSESNKIYNIDKNSGNIIALSSLFKKDADYITPISKYIKEEMASRNKNENMAFFIDKKIDKTAFEKINQYSKFYLNKDNKIVIVFDKGEVGANFMGSTEFVIPDDAVSKIKK